MTAKTLFKELKILKAYKKDRVRLGVAAVEHDLLADLIEFSRAQSEVSHQACWCLEQSFLIHEKECYPYLANIAALFTEPINSSGMRSLVKIAYICCKKYYGKRTHEIEGFLNRNSREHMLEGCFRTLIEHEGKTANQAFATRALFDLGKEFEWIHPELKIKIEQIMDCDPTSGYRACGKDILIKIESYQLKN
ncbi:MAG: adenylosuccinate lyase [Nonlabens sp.]